MHHSFSVHGAPGISESGNRRRAYATRWVGEGVLFDPRPGKLSLPQSLFLYGFDIIERENFC